MSRFCALSVLIFVSLTSPHAESSDKTLKVGGKAFTESAVLAEIMSQLIEARTDFEVERKGNLGGTKICFDALCEGSIDLYAEYTGTAWTTILKNEEPINDPLEAYLRVSEQCEDVFDVHWLMPFGFNNTYALILREELATDLGIESISELSRVSDRLKVGFTVEFLGRPDGWPGLKNTYNLKFEDVRGMEHSLAYTALDAREIDVMDAYSTDGKLKRYPTTTLKDDKNYFPPYQAAPLIRGEFLRAHPEVQGVLNLLAFRLSDARMQELNYAVEEKKQSLEEVAHGFLKSEGLIDRASIAPKGGVHGGGFFALMFSRWRVTLELILEHVVLTVISVVLAACFAIPLGIFMARRALLARVALAVAGIMQTVPSLALLALMIPLFGLDATSAVAALFLYALLPILRNTFTGIREVDSDIIEAARGIGLRKSEILRNVELPLAACTIMAGIRTSTVIGIGVATLAAFIGAGGLGEPIISGLYLNDSHLILSGAIPAALLALIADALLGLLERRLSPSN